MIPKYSVKRPFTVAVAVVMVFILGIVSFFDMKTDLLPSIDLPYAMVLTGKLHINIHHLIINNHFHLGL